jgi:hypothetical protein
MLRGMNAEASTKMRPHSSLRGYVTFAGVLVAFVAALFW